MEVGRGLGVLCAAAANCDGVVHGVVGEPDYECIFRHARKTFRAPLSCGAAARGAVQRGGAHEQGNDAPLPATHLEKSRPERHDHGCERRGRVAGARRRSLGAELAG